MDPVRGRNPSSPPGINQIDDLYPAAYRLARLYAILSPRVLMRDLKIDRERAEALLVELERQGVVGPTVILGTGARESLVNVVQDAAATTPGLITGTDSALGRRTVAVACGAAVLGLVCVVGLQWLGIGRVVSSYFRVEVGSPVLAAAVIDLLPVAGLGIGWLGEYPLRSEEDLTPYWALRARSAIWTTASLIAIGLATVSLLR